MPFMSKHSRQIELVNDFSWLDFNKLDDYMNTYKNLFNEFSDISDDKLDIIDNLLYYNIGYLENVINKK